MSNESMANYITDIPSGIAELLAVNKQLEQELQKVREQLEKAEKVISADIGYNVFEFHRLREEYLENKENKDEK